MSAERVEAILAERVLRAYYSEWVGGQPSTVVLDSGEIPAMQTALALVAAETDGLAERVAALADEIREAGDLKLPALYVAGRVRALLAQPAPSESSER